MTESNHKVTLEDPRALERRLVDGPAGPPAMVAAAAMAAADPDPESEVAATDDAALLRAYRQAGLLPR